MGLMEWWGESYNPGNVGGFDTPTRKPIHKRWAVFVRFAVAVILLGVGFYLLFAYAVEPTNKSVALALAVAFFYLFIAYLIRPAPDMENIGWCGGLFDNPFRYSDDINRTLLSLKLILMPGRLIAAALVDMVILVANANKMGYGEERMSQAEAMRQATAPEGETAESPSAPSLEKAPGKEKNFEDADEDGWPDNEW
ncbi:MAG: hypothetical protein ACLFWL_18725 [Candidatus Brocadiia bacterium]